MILTLICKLTEQSRKRIITFTDDEEKKRLKGINFCREIKSGSLGFNCVHSSESAVNIWCCSHMQSYLCILSRRSAITPRGQYSRYLANDVRFGGPPDSDDVPGGHWGQLRWSPAHVYRRLGGERRRADLQEGARECGVVRGRGGHAKIPSQSLSPIKSHANDTERPWGTRGRPKVMCFFSCISVARLKWRNVFHFLEHLGPHTAPWVRLSAEMMVCSCSPSGVNFYHLSPFSFSNLHCISFISLFTSFFCLFLFCKREGQNRNRLMHMFKRTNYGCNSC